MDLKNKSDIVKYFNSGCKKKNKLQIGVEHEKFLFNNISRKRINFSTVLKVFNYLKKYNWKPIKEGKNIISLSEEWSKDTLPFTLKLEWMSNLMMDAIRYQKTKEQKNLMKDTSNISMYLGERTNFNILYNLLISTNNLWSLFKDGTNLKSEYQLQKLFIDWESKLGLSVR